VSVLGGSVTVNANTRLEDRTVRGSTAQAFNINTFASYINALTTPPSVAIQGYVDPVSQQLVAVSFTIVRSNTSVALFGKVSNMPTDGTSLTVAGLPVTSASGTTTVTARGRGTATTLAAILQGDFVLASGTESAGSGVTAAAIQDFGANVGERALH
jgi:hypothetical protein